MFVNVGPHVTATEGWPWKFEVDLLGSDISLLDAGGIVLALQVTTYVRWHMWFHDRDGKVVKEWHQVLVSLPMLYKLQGPRMLLMAVSPWPETVAHGGQNAVAFKKLKEVNKVLGLIRPSGQISWCLEDITALEKRLQKLEEALDKAHKWMLRGSSDGDLASIMKHEPFDSGRFAGARFA